MASAVYQGAVARIGQRLIGRLVGLSAMTVGRRIQDLVDMGHIRASKCKRGERGWYELTSPVFGQRQGKESVIISRPRRRLASVEVA
jgi:DNA-binding Lrp family transcriptional regulator